MILPPDDPRLARLAVRLALPERAPDDHFVARVDYALKAKALSQHASRQRLEQVLVDVAAGAALLLGARQIAGAGEGLAALLTPEVPGFGSLALLAVGASLLLSFFAESERESVA